MLHVLVTLSFFSSKIAYFAPYMIVVESIDIKKRKYWSRDYEFMRGRGLIMKKMAWKNINFPYSFE